MSKDPSMMNSCKTEEHPEASLTNKDIVFMIGVGRCGMYLASSLLDGHDQLLILPFSMKFFHFWKQYDCDSMDDPEVLGDLLLEKTPLSRLLPSNYESNFCDDCSYDFSSIAPDILESSLKDYLREHGTSRRSAHLAIYHAYAQATGRDTASIKCLVADSFYSDHTKEIFDDFPRARLLHVLRDPRSNVSSLKAFSMGLYGTLVHPSFESKVGKSILLQILCLNMLANMKMLLRNRASFGDERHRVLRYEDIVLDPPGTMQHLASWLGIDFNTTLLIPTKAGQPFIGDSGFNDKPITTMDETPLHRWKKHLSAREICMVEYLFGIILDQFGYERSYDKSLVTNRLGALCCLLPWKDEIFYRGYRRGIEKQSKLKRFLKRNVQPFLFLTKNIAYLFSSRMHLLGMFKRGELPLKPNHREPGND